MKPSGQENQRSWKVVRSEPGPDLKIFKARFDWVENPRNKKNFRAVVLETPEWVNVVALTDEMRILAVSQFRFGVRRQSLEIPAGLIDPGEAPLQAAMRELDEETGCAAREWKSLGWSFAQPAFLDNRAHHFLALGVRKVHEPKLDEGEDLDCRELTLAEVREAVRTGRMRNSMTLLALSKVFDMREEVLDIE
ncbi:MAG: NUDIX hydrolase [Anaerolineales bacterium]|nr:NUDIX hydrolase [Anaerolineales bacterium]